jgi:hypothetical protein
MAERKAAQPQIIYDSSLKLSKYRVVVDGKLCGDFLRRQAVPEDQINDSVLRIKHFSLPEDLRDYPFQLGRASFDRSVSLFVNHPYVRAVYKTIPEREILLTRILAHELTHLADMITDPQTIEKSTLRMARSIGRIEAVSVVGFALAEKYWGNGLYDDLRMAGIAVTLSGLAGLVVYCGNETERRAEEASKKYIEEDNKLLITISQRLQVQH